MGIYLDYNASAPIDRRVLERMIEVYQNVYGNADSRTHHFGDQARKIVENAREQVASLLAINKDEVIFTSGATESDNIAIRGLKSYGISANKKHIITTSIEHKAVLESAKAMQKQGFEVDFIDPDETGRILIQDVLNKVREDTLLVSIMHVNNETGIIQPVKEIGEILTDRDILFHIDATQSFGKLVDELKETRYNMLSMSAHKLGGPQGVGALILRKEKYKFPPVRAVMYGGQQEYGIRPGTVPVALAAGLGKACELAQAEYIDNSKKCRMINNRLIELLKQSGLQYKMNGEQEYCVSNTMNLCICGVSSEALMLATKDYCGISNGSACNSNSYKPSYVLTAMGVPADQVENSIRISWGPEISVEEIEQSFGRMLEIARGLVW